MGSAKFKLECFNGKGDFLLWKEKLKQVLVQQRVARAIEDPTKWPEEFKKKTDEIEEMNALAYSTIYLHLSDIRFFGFKMDFSKDLDKNLDEFNKITMALMSNGEKFTYEHFAVIFLNPLPDSYSNLKDVMEYGRDTLTSEIVINSLRSKELDLKMKGKASSNGEGLFVRGRPTAKKNYKGGKRGKSQNRGRSHNAGEVLTVTTQEYKQEWILDSGCTFHMCPTRDWFKEYKELDGGKVLIGNNIPCQIVGIGNISIRMFDGSVKILSGVRHVPNLHRNLISIGSLVIMKGLKQNGLYVLQGTTITGEAAAAIPNIQDKTDLWHKSFKTGVHKTNGALEYIHADLWGPAKTQTQGGNKYFLSLIDDYSKKRMNRTLVDKVHCMLVGSGLPKMFWGEALMTACYIVNQSPSTAIDLKTPNEIWFGKPKSYSNMRVFGCLAYTHQNEGKLEPRAVELAKPIESTQIEVEQPDTCYSSDEEQQQVPEGEEQEQVETHEEMPTTSSDYQLTRDRSKRQVKPTQRFGYSDFAAFALISFQELTEVEPKTYLEAIKGKQANQWVEAMKEELSSLKKNGTWQLVVRPKDQKVVVSKWIYKVKEGVNKVDPIRFKARLVAKGFTQRERIDYYEIFSPVIKYTTIRVMLVLAAHNSWEIE
ncbi:hypothetical protein UlMin_040759 [Ulmus minor]